MSHLATRVVPATLVISFALALCLVAWWPAAPEDVPAAGAGARVVLALKAKRVGRANQLEVEAKREAALARLEAKKVKALQKQLSTLQTKKSLKTAKHQILNTGNSDMQNGEREKGVGYWDKEHHDDNWVPVEDMVSKLAERKTAWESEEQANERVKRMDAFVDEDKAEAPVIQSANTILAMNEREKEFSDDDDFEPPPSEITPAHRVPVQEAMSWQSKAGEAIYNLWNFDKR